MAKYFLLFSSMFLAVVGQLLLKSGLNQKEISLNLGSLISAIFSPKIFAGFLSYGLSSIIWLFVLKKFPLSIAYPALSLTYMAIVFLSWRFLGELLTPFKIAGVLLLITGVFLLFR